MKKIDQFKHKKIIVIFTALIYTIFFSGCYSSKDVVIDGSQLKDKASYDDINNVTLYNSTGIKFSDSVSGSDAAYHYKYKNLNDIILYESKIDTAIKNEKIHTIDKYHYLEVRDILSANVSKMKINPGLTALVIGGVLVALIAFITIEILHNGIYGGGFHFSL